MKKLTSEHIPLLRKYVDKAEGYCCENTFGFIYLWKDVENIHFAEEDGVMYIVSFVYGSANFYFPFGDNITNDCFKQIDEYCTANELKLKFWYLIDENLPALKEYFGDRIELKNERDWADYLYAYEDLRFLEGKKYKTQRNHISKFSSSYHYEFVAYDSTKKDIILEFCKHYYKEQNKESTLFMEERKVLQYLVDNYEEVGMLGGILIVDGSVVGISFGEIKGDTLYVHFEKALIKYSGSYATTNNMYLQLYEHPDVKYVNREEDVGDEGLRTAKLRLRPIRLVDKYFVDVD